MPGVIIAAHNEEQIINATLAALTVQQAPDVEIIVSANGCTDRTADLARQHSGVVVIERTEPGKAAALNAGDQVASGYPRVYLDADIVLPTDGLSRLFAHLGAEPGRLAVVPRRDVNLDGRPWLVRAHSKISQRLPAYRHGLFGRGVIALSEEGRRRFEAFPNLIADDLFLDSLFGDDEKAQVDAVTVRVEAPFTTRDLLRRLIRVRRGNNEMRCAGTAGEVPVHVRPSDRWAWLKDVVLQEPRLMPAAVPYVGLTVVASLLARLKPVSGQTWGRDESTRMGSATDGTGAVGSENRAM